MTASVSRIARYGPASEHDFRKSHREISRYNECFLFEMLADNSRSGYLEIIPEKRLRDNIHCDLDSFKDIVRDFGTKGILPATTVSYDSHTKELKLEFETDQRYRVVDSMEFSRSPESVLRACVLAAEVYRKACYFRRFTGKAPHIIPENLLIDTVTDSVVFRTVGRSLCALHVFEGATVGDEEADIARMLSTLLGTLIFKSPSELDKFMQQTTHQGVNAFLSLFIKNMRAKDPSHRYSCSRFNYLVDQLSQADEPSQPKKWLEIVYLREQLKASLFRFNTGMITWHGVCRTLNKHLSTDIRAVCNRETLLSFPFRSRLRFSGGGKPQLHLVSRHLLELALCREDLRGAEKCGVDYLDLVELLLLYSSICLEVVSIGRTLHSTQALQELLSSPLMSCNRVPVRAGDFETDIAVCDLATLIVLQPRESKDDVSAALTLEQISLQSLFACGIEFDGAISVTKPDAMRDEVFHIFAHACLVRIPRVESLIEKQIELVLLALRSNENFSGIDGLEEMRDAVKILAKDLKRIRSGLGLSRHHGCADGRYFPPDVRCRTLFHRRRIARESALPGGALTNSFPSSTRGYACSWDLHGAAIPNLMIPSEGLNSLIGDLKAGKIFGRKLSYMYSGRTMILWDTVALIVTALGYAYCDIMKGLPNASGGAKGAFSVLALLIGTIVLTLGGKWLLHDLGHWVPWHRQFINFIRHKFRDEKRPPEDSSKPSTSEGSHLDRE